MNDLTLNRRDFLKALGGLTAALAVPSAVFNACKKEIRQAADAKPVIWLQAQSCSGCSVSLLNSIEPDIATIITRHISLNFHQTLSSATGDILMNIIRDAVSKKRKDFILIVEGSIPTKASTYCTLGTRNNRHTDIKNWIVKLGKLADSIIAVGSCATFGGIPAASGNSTGAQSVADILPKRTVINIPGCPIHPDWVTGTLLHLLLQGTPQLDEYKRPKMYFSKTVHELCEHLDDYERGKFAQYWGDNGCLYLLGCLGIDTNCDIPKRKWVETGSCTGCGSGCIGCTERVFPDTGDRGLYMHKMADARKEIYLKNKINTRREV